MEFFFFVGLIFYSAIAGIWFLLGYFFIRLITSKEKTGHYFGLFFTGTMVALAGYWGCEMGYQMNFWEAPGIWGAPGKQSTVWGQLQYILLPLDFFLGISIDRMLERKYRDRIWSIRLWLAIPIVLLMIATNIMISQHSIQTLG